MTPNIPPELWDGIIGHLHDDTSTLCKCGLVCRLWLWFSRSHLFSTILLWCESVETALAVLCAPGSTIPPHVRALEINGGMTLEWSPPWVSDVLSTLPQLSAVEKLTLSHFDWSILTPEAKDHLFTISRNLKSLTLNVTVFKTLAQALQLISSAPSLESLSVEQVYFDSKDTPFTKFSAPPLPPMKNIIFSRMEYAPVELTIELVYALQPVPSVRNLTFDGILPAEIPSVSAWIRRLGPDLERLELACSIFDRDVGTQAALRKEIDLTRNTSLQIISFDALFLYSDSSGSHNFDWIRDILSQITSRFIQRVTLGVFLSTTQELAPVNLPALAALFASESTTFAEHSTILQFGIYGDVDRTEAQAAIAESLHELDSQGRLEFGECRIGTSI